MNSYYYYCYLTILNFELYLAPCGSFLKLENITS